MHYIINIILFIFILTFSYLIKSKQVDIPKDEDLITNEDIQSEKERLNKTEFDIEFRKYKMSR